MKALIDTNVLLDVLCERQPHVEASAGIWSLAETGRLTGCIAAISVTNIYYIIRRLTDHRKAMQAMVLLRDIFTLAACDGQVLNQAIDARFTDLEDAVQWFSALHVGADVLITRNVRHFPRTGLSVVTPAEFLAAQEDTTTG